MDLSSTWTAISDAGMKSAVLCAAGLLMAACLMRRSSAARRHAVLTATLIACLILPALSLLLPHWRALPQWTALPAVPSAVTTATPASDDQPFPAPAPRTSAPEAPADLAPAIVSTPAAHPSSTPAHNLPALRLTEWLTLAWLAGAALLLLPVLVGQLAIRHIRRSARPLQGVLVSAHCHMPMACGIIRPAIILPADAQSWSASRREAVIRHESAHLRRHDCLWQQLGQLTRALYWFNPLIWLAYHRMLCEAERACDDAVLKQGSAPSDYAEHLLAIATAGRSDRFLAAAAIAMARPNSLEGRLLSILDHARSRQRVTAAVVATTGCAIIAIAVPLASLQAQTPPAAGLPPTTAPAATTRPMSVVVDRGVRVPVPAEANYKPAFSDDLHLRPGIPPIGNEPKPADSGYTLGGRTVTGTVTITSSAALSEGYLLEFWTPIVADGQQPSISRQAADELIARCRKVGPFELKPLANTFLWKEVSEALARQSPNLIYADFSGRTFLLVSNAPEHRMCYYGDPGAWRVTSARKTRDDMGRPVVSFTFDDEGARRFGDFTSRHLRQVIAATVNNKVVSLATVQSRIERSGILTSSDMTDRAADDIVNVINNPPRFSALPSGVRIAAAAPAVEQPAAVEPDTQHARPTSLPTTLWTRESAQANADAIRLKVVPSTSPREYPVVNIQPGDQPEFAWDLPAEPKVDYLGFFIVPVPRPDVQNMPQQQLWKAMNDPSQMMTLVLGFPGEIHEFKLKSIGFPIQPAGPVTIGPVKQLTEGFYLVVLSGYQGRYNPREGRQPVAQGTCVLKVGNPVAPPKPDYSKLTPDQMQSKVQEWVEDFFSSNYRDVTARKTLEWGKAQKLDNGNWQVRYKYEAEIWRKDKIIQDKLFTFTPEGGFVAVSDAVPAR